MATVSKRRWGLHRRDRPKPAKRDADAEQLRRDRLTAVLVVVVMAVILAVLITIASISGLPSGSETIEPWMIP
jgi:hypothetical protein